MKRARSPLLTLAGVVLLGTVLLWVGTRGTAYWWATNSLPGGRGLKVEVGGGHIAFYFVDSKRCPDILAFPEGFGSCTVDERYRAILDGVPDFYWDTPFSGFVHAYCPVWFPGTLVGGLLLGWGLLCRRDGERISEPEEPR